MHYNPENIYEGFEQLTPRLPDLVALLDIGEGISSHYSLVSYALENSLVSPRQYFGECFRIERHEPRKSIHWNAIHDYIQHYHTLAFVEPTHFEYRELDLLNNLSIQVMYVYQGSYRDELQLMLQALYLQLEVTHPHGRKAAYISELASRYERLIRIDTGKKSKTVS